MKHLLRIAAVSVTFAGVGLSQDPDPTRWESKLTIHATRAFGPAGLVRGAATAALLQRNDSPTEWGQGGLGYGKRLGSTLAGSGVRNGLAFGLDAALHQDPRYYRSGDGSFLRRMAHALRGTILTRTDSGGETLSTWRLGSAYGAAFISNQWHPDRLNTVGLGLKQGTAQIGFDLLGNVVSEFLPDLKNKLLHRQGRQAD